MGGGTAFKIGDFVGQAAVSEIVPAIAADVAFVGPATKRPVVKGLFGRTTVQGIRGLLNRGDLLRTGFGWNGNLIAQVFRTSGDVVTWLSERGMPSGDHVDWIIYRRLAND